MITAVTAAAFGCPDKWPVVSFNEAIATTVPNWTSAPKMKWSELTRWPFFSSRYRLISSRPRKLAGARAASYGVLGATPYRGGMQDHVPQALFACPLASPATARRGAGSPAPLTLLAS